MLREPDMFFWVFFWEKTMAVCKIVCGSDEYIWLCVCYVTCIHLVNLHSGFAWSSTNLLVGTIVIIEIQMTATGFESTTTCYISEYPTVQASFPSLTTVKILKRISYHWKQERSCGKKTLLPKFRPVFQCLALVRLLKLNQRRSLWHGQIF